MLDNIVFKPVLSWPVLIGVGGIAFVAIIAGYALTTLGNGKLCRITLTVLRLGVLTMLLLILARPMAYIPEASEKFRLTFGVLVDSSESMNTEDVDGRSRFTAARDSLMKRRSQSLLQGLAEEYQVKLYRFDKTLHPASAGELARQQDAEGKQTCIAQALMEATRTSNAGKPKGLLLVSDGRSNEPDARVEVNHAARTLRMMQIPVWTVPVGEITEVKDVSIIANLNASYLLADQPGSIRVSVFGTGYDHRPVTLHLYREDSYLSSTQVNLVKGHAEAEFPIQEALKGVYQYHIEAEPFEDEADMDNNRRYVIARVVDEKIKVLVVEAKPHWDSKFLLRALRADMNIEVTSIFHINRRKTVAVVEQIAEDNALVKTVTPGVKMPRTREALYHYDCVLLGKDMEDVFTSADLRLLRDYVAERGGSVVFFRGKPYEGRNRELETLEPIQWGKGSLTDTRFELTSLGQSNPMFEYGSADRPSDAVVRELPSMTSITRVADEKSLAVILAKTRDHEYGGEMATVAYHRYGKGKVMSIGALGLWQWGFLTERLQEYDDIHARFWGQMIRWLVSDSEFLPGRDISFVVDRHTYQPGDRVRLAVSAKMVDPLRYRPEIELTDPQGRTEMLYPLPQADNDSIYAVFYTPQQRGQYRAVLSNNIGEPKTDMVRFTVYDYALENRCVHADRDLLAHVAKTTGGDMLELDEVETLPAKIKTFERLSRDRVKPKDIWDRGSVFTLLVAMLGCEWLLRRMSGLV